MCHPWLKAAALLSSIFISSLSLAQTVNSEEAKLEAYQQQLSDLQAKQQQLQTQLSQDKADLEPLLTTVPPEKSEMDAANMQLEAARAEFDADSTPENKARLKNIEFKLALAERKYEKANSKQIELQQSIQKLSSSLTANTSAINSLNKSIYDQRLALDQARSRQAAAKKAQLAEEKRLKEQAAAAEIAQLKAKLEKQQREKEASKLAAAAAAKAAKTAKMTASSAAATKSSSGRARASSESGVIFLSSAADIQAEKQHLGSLLATPQTQKGSKHVKILNVKPVSANGEVGSAKAKSLQPLGHHQYRGTASLPEGTVIFVVGFNTWEQQVPQAAEYTVIYDGTDSDKPRLVFLLAAGNNLANL